MGTITSSGVGSGLDIEGLVTKLVSAEGSAKASLLQTQQSTVQTKISAYGQLKSALAQLQSASSALKDAAIFKSRSASVADADVLSVGAGSTAAPGSYNVEVVRLASAAKLNSNPFTNSGTVVGTGQLTLSLGAKSVSISIGDANNTLAGIRDAINSAVGNPGISATIVTANDGARLVLTTSTTGAANSIKVTQSGGDGGLAQIAYDPTNGVNALTQIQAAQDARVIVDGFTFDSASNSVTGALDGVTLNLKKPTATGVTTAVTVGVDNSKPQATISGFVTAYNQVVSALRSMGAYDAATQKGGVLVGDSLLRNALTSVRGLANASSDALTGNAFRTLSDIGITTNLDGTLTADASKISAALTKDAGAVSRLFTDPSGGYASRLDAVLSSYVKVGGLIEARTGGLQSTLKDISRRQDDLQAQLTSYEKRLRAQFTAMDTLVANLKQTGQNLVSELSSINPNYYGR
jgi:flagellar hook-associated protein 2